MTYWLTAQESAQSDQCFIGPKPPGSWIDTTDLDLVAVFTADADAEHEPTWGGFAQTCDLPSDGDRVPKRQEVDAYVDIERGLKGGRCGRLDQAVHAETRMETDVIGDEDVVEADPGDMLQAGSPIGVRASQHFCVGENTDL